jgi:hypothetical protein
MRTKKKITEQIVQLYHSGKHAWQVGEMLGCCKTTVYSHLKSVGIQRRKREECLRRYDLDTNFFSAIDNESKAYWLGFIVADGAIVGTKISVKLAVKDQEHVCKLKACIGTNIPIVLGEGTRKGVVNKFCRLDFTSKKMVTDLAMHRVLPRKSLREEFPLGVGSDIERHFLRGLFDGDGCIRNVKYGHILTYVGSEGIVSAFRNRLVAKFGVTPQKPRCVRNLHYVSFGRKNDISLILSYLYNDSSWYLDRKYKKSREILECQA